MTTAHRLLEGGFRLIAKGAPDVLIARCTQLLQGGEIRPLTGAMKAKLLSDNSRLAERALRVLAVAYRDVSALPSDDRESESQLIFCGLIAMEDPPRPGVKEAVTQCKRAGHPAGDDHRGPRRHGPGHRPEARHCRKLLPR